MIPKNWLLGTSLAWHNFRKIDRLNKSQVHAFVYQAFFRNFGPRPLLGFGDMYFLPHC